MSNIGSGLNNSNRVCDSSFYYAIKLLDSTHESKLSLRFSFGATSMAGKASTNEGP